MLYFTRWKAAAIVLTALFICLFAVPNFLPEKMVQSWPKWAQRHVVLGLDLQGGSHILLEIDTKAVRKEMLETLRDDMRRVLRDARIGYTGLVVRGNSAEVRIREGTSADQAQTKLATLSQPLGGLLGGTGGRNIDVTAEAGGLIRLTLSDPAIIERVRQSVEQSIQIIERRVNELGTVEPLIQREGTDRILVQVPGLQDPTRLKQLLGKTAKLDFRMVDTGASPGTGGARPHAAGRRPAVQREPAEDALSGRETGAGVGRRSHRRAAGLRPAHQRADRVVPLQHLGRAQIRAGDAGKRWQAVRHRFRSEERRVGKECRSRWSP